MPRKKRQKDRDEIARNMSAIRSTGGKAEVQLRSRLHRMGLRFRKNVTRLTGKPDIVFASARVAVFVDGDYWHGRLLREQGLTAVESYYSTEQQSYWVGKIQRNVARDELVTAALRADGWLVLRYWESLVKADLDKCAREIATHIRRRS